MKIYLRVPDEKSGSNVKIPNFSRIQVCKQILETQMLCFLQSLLKIHDAKFFGQFLANFVFSMGPRRDKYEIDQVLS